MKNNHFKETLSDKIAPPLSNDFDSEMMSIIHKHVTSKNKSKKYIQYMYLFFLIGLVFGFILATNFNDVKLGFNNYSYTITKTVLIIPLAGVLLFIFDKIYTATLVRLGKEEFS